MTLVCKFTAAFEKSIEVKTKCIKSGFSELSKMGDAIVLSLKSGGKLMVCGNGGSAADAQHLVAELLVRLRPWINRPPIAAITLAQDSSTLTACGNDFSFEQIFERVVLGLGKPGDCLLGISTSGNSENIVLAMQAARQMGISVIGLLGNDGGLCKKECDVSFIVPSNDTAAIQEAHIVAGHALMEFVENEIIS